MRAIITALITILFILSYNFYLYSGYKGYFVDEFMRKAFIYAVFLAFYLPISVMGNYNKKSSMEIEFRKIAQLINFTTVGFIILAQFGIVNDILNKLFWFNGLNFAFIVIVLTNGFKHGIFKAND